MVANTNSASKSTASFGEKSFQAVREGLSIGLRWGKRFRPSSNVTVAIGGLSIEEERMRTFDALK